MRIAILSCFYPYRGGISQFNSGLYKELEKEHTVCAFNFKRQYPGFLFPGKTQYVTENDNIQPVESVACLDTINPISWEKTATAIREWAPELLIMRYWNPWFALPLGFVARRMPPQCKVVAILDNVIPHEKHFFDRLLTKFFLGSADGFITLCREVASDLTALKKNARYSICHHPVYNNFGTAIPKEEAEEILGIKHGRKNLLFFGLIRDYKGLDILIEAFDRLGPNFELIIAGEPYGSFEKYQRQMDASPGRKRMHVFPRFIKDSEVKNFFSAADVCVLPYKSATQSGISAISYQFDVPLIVTDVGGLKETVGESGTGLVSPSATPAFIAQKINEFFENPSIHKNCVESIRREKESLTWQNFSANLIKFAQNL
ncbi:MAG: glycosyltransferase [Bacteroidales bacterium]|nr:glycosyltransferase [Bacteroidales bacterium]